MGLNTQKVIKKWKFSDSLCWVRAPGDATALQKPTKALEQVIVCRTMDGWLLWGFTGRPVTNFPGFKTSGVAAQALESERVSDPTSVVYGLPDHVHL